MDQIINSLKMPEKGSFPLVMWFRITVVSRHTGGHDKVCCYAFLSRKRVELAGTDVWYHIHWENSHDITDFNAQFYQIKM